MPGVHDGAPETVLQVAPTVPPVGAQFDPVQQRFGRGEGWGVHVMPGAQPPVVRDRKAMRFVPDMLNQMQHRRGRQQHDRIVPIGKKNMLMLFGQPHGRRPAPQLLQHLQRRG